MTFRSDMDADLKRLGLAAIAPRRQPTPDHIISAVANRFEVSREQAAQWMRTIDWMEITE